MPDDKPRRGRPPRGDAAATYTLRVRLTDEERARLFAVAEDASAFVREATMRAVERAERRKQRRT